MACPISQVKDYCLPEWLSHVSKLSYPNKDYYFVDNTKDRSYHKSINRIGFDCDHIKPKKDLNDTLAESQNMIREKVLSDGYDYLMFIECDQFVPLDIIEKLSHHNNQVVGISYPIFRGENIRSVATKSTSMGNHVKMQSLRVEEEFSFSGNGLMRVDAIGFGCVLIHRNVLEKVKFRNGKDGCATDSSFYEDCYRLNIPIHIDTDKTSHHNSDGVGIKPNQNKYA